MNNSILKRLLSIFIALLLFFYIGYQIYSANYSTVRTETALSKTEADTIETTGIAIRKESLIEQPVSYTHLDVYKRQYVNRLFWSNSKRRRWMR